MGALKKRFPPPGEILSLYATIVFLIYGWASLTFTWKIPSWLYYLSLADITAILSYALVSSFLESTILLSLFLLLAVLLPSSFFVNKFIVRGSIVVYIVTFWMILFNLRTLIRLPSSRDLILFGVASVLTVSLSILFADRLPSFQKILIALGDRLTVFLYLWLPMTALGVLVVLVRMTQALLGA